jgi:hypothetical protein
VFKFKVKVEDTDLGFARVAQMMGEMGAIALGVQGKEAEEQHPNSELKVGQVAAIHELGIGVPTRSWLRSWIDANQKRMADETAEALRRVMKGASRKAELIELGKKWTDDVRDQIDKGKIGPALAARTIARKGGETRPLVDSKALMNAITYKLFLPQLKSILDKPQRIAARKQTPRG